MSNGYNPYRGSDGRFKSGPSKRRIQYASSDEWRDVVDNNEDLKQTQLQNAQNQQNRLQHEEEQKAIDLRIGELEREIEYHKEKYAAAYTEDDRKSAEQQIRLCKKAIKNLQAKKS